MYFLFNNHNNIYFLRKRVHIVKSTTQFVQHNCSYFAQRQSCCTLSELYDQRSDAERKYRSELRT